MCQSLNIWSFESFVSCSYGKKSMRASVGPDICCQRDVSAAFDKFFNMFFLGCKHLRQDRIRNGLTTRRSVLWVKVGQKRTKRNIVSNRDGKTTIDDEFADQGWSNRALTRIGLTVWLPRLWLHKGQDWWLWCTDIRLDLLNVLTV